MTTRKSMFVSIRNDAGAGRGCNRGAGGAERDAAGGEPNLRIAFWPEGRGPNRFRDRDNVAGLDRGDRRIYSGPTGGARRSNGSSAERVVDAHPSVMPNRVFFRRGRIPRGGLKEDSTSLAKLRREPVKSGSGNLFEITWP